MSLLVLLATAPMFLPIPVYDTNRYCRTLVQDGLIESFGSEEDCRTEEEQSREGLEEIWALSTEKTREACKILFADRAGGSYSILLMCLGQAGLTDYRKFMESGQPDGRAPPCKSQQAECLPWERDWKSTDQIGRNDVVTMDGSILRGPR